MYNRLIKLTLVIALCCSVVLAGCSSTDKESDTETSKGTTTTKSSDDKKSSEEPVSILFPTFQVGVNSSAPLLTENLRLFEEQYGDKINVQVEEIPGDQAYVDKMKILLSAGDLPDLVYAGGYNLLDLALAKDQVVDLTPYLEADPEWKASFTEDDLAFNSRDGKYYGVPEEKQPIGYFYNKELFAQVGLEGPAKTWDEFFEQCETLLEAGIIPVSMDSADSGWVTNLWLNSIVATSGPEGLEFANGYYPKDFNNPAFIDGMSKIQMMYQKYTTIDAVGGKYEHAANNFLSGKTAMIANGPWMISDFNDTDKTEEGFADKVGSAIYPGNGLYDAPMYGYLVASKDKTKADATVEFLKFITNEEAQLRGLDMIGRIPASPSIELTDDIKAKYPLLAELIEASASVEYRYPTTQSAWYPNVVDRFSSEAPALATGDITPEEFAERMTETAEKN